MPVYLIHLDRPMKHARHYIGFCERVQNIPDRLEHHRAGRGSRMLKAATEIGITYEVVRIWKRGSRDFERKLKNGARAPALCPYCNPSGSARLAIDRSE